MAERQNDVLIERTDSEETVLNAGTPRRQSDARAFKIAGITMLACLFVAGQALTAYFVISQKSQITTLETSTGNLRKQLMESSRGRDLAPKMVHMPLYNMPFLMDMSSDNKKIPMKKLQDTVMVSMEKQVKDLLKEHQFPNFNETFLTNLQSFKEQVNESEWKGLETWMHYWLVFQMAQQKPPASTPGPEPTPRGESSLQTKCQLEAGGMGSVKPGFFRPQCDQLGNYLPMQCWHSTGYCWCVDKDGVEIPNTLVRGRPVCGGGPMAARMVAFPAMAKMRTIKDEEN